MRSITQALLSSWSMRRLVGRIGVMALAAAGACTRPRGPVESGALRPGPQQHERWADADLETEPFARLALACIEREYPNKLAHVMASEADLGTPRALTPAFYGCFDWHSAVHGHWLLVRLLRRDPSATWAAQARDALVRNLGADNLAAELAYLDRPDRVGFERPYGLAWLLQLGIELRQWDDPVAPAMVAAIAPIERLAADRLGSWAAKLTHAVRSGEHSQSAFALGIALDWARHTGDANLERLLERRAIAMHGGDRGCNFAFEPSGQDFLSPCLGAADLMRRVLSEAEFAGWLDHAFAGGASGMMIAPAVPSDRSDGKLVHLDGLNLSRAWMLEGIAAGLPDDDARRPALLEAAHAHAEAGLRAVADSGYEGGHWLATFAVYLVTRGAATDPARSTR